MEWMRQCCMERPTERGKECLIGWIDEAFARIGKKLKLQNEDDDSWEYGWVVTAVGGRQSRAERTERHNDFKRQRKGSDMNRGSRHIEK
jgi:hypothetical protein